MGVFKNFQHKNQDTDVVVQEQRPCRGGHRWGGVIPTVDGTIHEVQNPHLIGKRCDCGSLVYAMEDMCGCPTNRYWKIYFEE